MAKKKKILLAAAFLLLLIVTISVADRVGKEFEFFDGAVFVADRSEQEEQVRELSDELGIVLNPGLDKHDELLSYGDRLVVRRDVFHFTETESGWWRGTVDPSWVNPSEDSLPEATLCAYTGGYECADYSLNFVLIDKGTQEINSLTFHCTEVMFQLRPKSNAYVLKNMMKSREIGMRETVQNIAFSMEDVESDIAFYLHSEQAGCWVVKEPKYMPLLEDFPTIMDGTSSGGRFGRMELLQAWGTAYVLENDPKPRRIRFEIRFDGEPLCNVSFWSPHAYAQTQTEDGEGS